MATDYANGTRKGSVWNTDTATANQVAVTIPTDEIGDDTLIRLRQRSQPSLRTTTMKASITGSLDCSSAMAERWPRLEQLLVLSRQLSQLEAVTLTST